MLEGINPGEWLKLNVELQRKKNGVRSELAEMGIQPRQGRNAFDNYSYFSEAQYKELFTRLFVSHRLELKCSELEYERFEAGGKQSNGRTARLQFTLIDVETGFFEESTITGEGMDKGDKAGYKAFTGALKYYLANTFLVATGDDPERESPKTERKRDYSVINPLKRRYMQALGIDETEASRQLVQALGNPARLDEEGYRRYLQRMESLVREVENG